MYVQIHKLHNYLSNAPRKNDSSNGNTAEICWLSVFQLTK